MSFKIISATQFNTINWSGGTSTQLYIYPENADYKLKNFDFRLSTAKVEVYKSDFTPLAKVSRKIMILDGEIEISHKDHYNKKLQKLDIDEFEGSWETSSIGTCIDFNLMTRGKTAGDLSSLILKKNLPVQYKLSKQYSKVFMYLYSGKLSFNFDENEHLLKRGELLILDKIDISNLNLLAHDECELIISRILS